MLYGTFEMADEHGVPYDWDKPDWSDRTVIHNWHNYINESLRHIWYSFSDPQKRIIATNAQELANREEWE